jgi:hypothetical protein
MSQFATLWVSKQSIYLGDHAKRVNLAQEEEIVAASKDLVYIGLAQKMKQFSIVFLLTYADGFGGGNMLF